ncbi:unnamed protein product [Penicillium pancosmium]
MTTLMRRLQTSASFIPLGRPTFSSYGRRHLREDLPEDVKKHNKEMDQRYDKPYNHIADGGNVEKGWKK